MNEYQLPEEPAGPVWDQHGSRWVRIPERVPSYRIPKRKIGTLERTTFRGCRRGG